MRGGGTCSTIAVRPSNPPCLRRATFSPRPPPAPTIPYWSSLAALAGGAHAWRIERRSVEGAARHMRRLGR
eukprot:6586782-Prymnesium_polylepis.1